MGTYVSTEEVGLGGMSTSYKTVQSCYYEGKHGTALSPTRMDADSKVAVLMCNLTHY